MLKNETCAKNMKPTIEIYLLSLSIIYLSFDLIDWRCSQLPAVHSHGWITRWINFVFNSSWENLTSYSRLSCLPFVSNFSTLGTTLIFTESFFVLFFYFLTAVSCFFQKAEHLLFNDIIHIYIVVDHFNRPIYSCLRYF